MAEPDTRIVWAYSGDGEPIEPLLCVRENWRYDGCPVWRPVKNPPDAPGVVVEGITCWLTQEEAQAQADADRQEQVEAERRV